MQIKFSLRKNLLKLAFEKDRKVLCFINTHYLLTGIILHVSQSTKTSHSLSLFKTYMDRKHEKLHTYSSRLILISKLYY